MVLGEIDVLDELLGDRAATLVEAQMQQVVESGLAGAQQIEASVLIEGAIFDGDGRLLHGGRHLGQGHDVLPLRPPRPPASIPGYAAAPRSHSWRRTSQFY